MDFSVLLYYSFPEVVLRARTAHSRHAGVARGRRQHLRQQSRLRSHRAHREDERLLQVSPTGSRQKMTLINTSRTGNSIENDLGYYL